MVSGDNRFTVNDASIIILWQSGGIEPPTPRLLDQNLAVPLYSPG